MMAGKHTGFAAAPEESTFLSTIPLVPSGCQGCRCLPFCFPPEEKRKHCKTKKEPPTFFWNIVDSFGGSGWIRTTEVVDNRFTVCPLWPLGNTPINNEIVKWSWWTDSNPRPADYKSAALPTELHQQRMLSARSSASARPDLLLETGRGDRI